MVGEVPIENKVKASRQDGLCMYNRTKDAPKLWVHKINVEEIWKKSMIIWLEVVQSDLNIIKVFTSCNTWKKKMDDEHS